MSVFFFVIQGHFSKGESTVFDLKHGVVSEPLRSPCAESDRAFAVPLHGCKHAAVGCCDAKCCTKACLAVVAVSQFSEEALNPFGVGVCVPRGIDTRSTAQCIHAQSGIICECPMASGFSNGPGLEECVIAEGDSGFLHFDPLGLWIHLQGQVLKQVRKFSDFAGIPAGNYEDAVAHMAAAKVRAQLRTSSTREGLGAPQ